MLTTEIFEARAFMYNIPVNHYGDGACESLNGKNTQFWTRELLVQDLQVFVSFVKHFPSASHFC